VQLGLGLFFLGIGRPVFAEANFHFPRLFDGADGGRRRGHQAGGGFAARRDLTGHFEPNCQILPIGGKRERYSCAMVTDYSLGLSAF